MRLHSLVANLIQSAERDPARIALVNGEVRTSYAQLLERSLSVAAFLESRQLQPGERVALILPNSCEYVAAYYGAMMMGGVVVALNTAAKAPELAAWLAHSGASWVFADARNPEVATALAAMASAPGVVWVHSTTPVGAGVDFGELTCAGKEPDRFASTETGAAASIIYTSGTTGAPKGVTLSHSNLDSNVEAIARYLSLIPEDCVVSVLPFYYSYGNSVLHTHIKVGACVVIEPSLVYPHAVPDALQRNRATGFAGVPSTYALLLSRVQLENYDLGSLRYVTQAGGAMSPELTRRLRKALPHAQLFVMYGQTEATARLTYLPPADLDRRLGSVGRPLSGVEIEIRREDRSIAAAQEGGEVWVRGPNVMLGYWQDPAASASVLADGWLKTGDMGYLDRDGYLYLHGRRSDMIKTGAHRVHPLDVENVIQELAAVAEVAVAGVDDDMLGQTIKAFVVAAPGATIDPMKIKAHCRERLANYKIPKYVEIVPALPKTASGKVRRHELQRNTA